MANAVLQLRPLGVRDDQGVVTAVDPTSSRPNWSLGRPPVLDMEIRPTPTCIFFAHPHRVLSERCLKGALGNSTPHQNVFSASRQKDENFGACYDQFFKESARNAFFLSLFQVAKIFLAGEGGPTSPPPSPFTFSPAPTSTSQQPPEMAKKDRKYALIWRNRVWGWILENLPGGTKYFQTDKLRCCPTRVCLTPPLRARRTAFFRSD